MAPMHLYHKRELKECWDSSPVVIFEEESGLSDLGAFFDHGRVPFTICRRWQDRK